LRHTDSFLQGVSFGGRPERAGSVAQQPPALGQIQPSRVELLVACAVGETETGRQFWGRSNITTRGSSCC
jgi:hypothetical protein